MGKGAEAAKLQKEWQERKAAAVALSEYALDHKKALAVLQENPAMLRAMTNAEHSWLQKSFFSQYSRLN